MGVDLYCDNISFGCSYGGWNEIRKIVIKSSFDYIQDKFQKDLELYKDLPEEHDNWIGEGSTYYCCKNDIIKLFEKLKVDSIKTNIFGMTIDNTVNVFIDITR